MDHNKFNLLKSHIDAYTRKDGSFVAAHDDKRQAAMPKPPSKAASSDSYDHPNVVGKPSKMVNGNWTKETGYQETEHTGKPTEAHAIHFAGKKYLNSGKTGTSAHDGTPTRAFNEDNGTGEGGHRVWLDDKARVHADSASEVAGLRKKHEAESASTAKKSDEGEFGPHKVGDTVSYKGDRGRRTGKVKGSRDGKVVVEHNAGYTELKHHTDLSPAK